MLRKCLLAIVIGLLCRAADTWRRAADDGPPTPGKSRIVAAPSLKNVETFRRKVLFFSKDVDLPCLRVPDNGGQPPDFARSVRLYGLPGVNEWSCSVEMTKDGNLVFLGPEIILRVNKQGTAEKAFSLADLTAQGVKSRRGLLHFEQLLGASTTAAILYLTASTEPEHAPGKVYTMREDSQYVGKLDMTTRKLLLTPRGTFTNIALDADAGTFYQLRETTVECRDFTGKARGQWPVSTGAASLELSPDKRTILIAPLLGLGDFSLLDLKSGRETSLPVNGRAAAWGASQTLFYLEEKKRDGGVLDTSLLRFRVGEKKPTRLFLVSCQRVKMLDSLLGSAPRLSADRSWLAWQLPVEDFHEGGTILLDITNGEYRIIKGRWAGVQWSSPQGGPPGD